MMGRGPARSDPLNRDATGSRYRPAAAAGVADLRL